MIHGTFTIKRARETSACVLVEAARIMPGGVYKIYSAALIPDIKQGSPQSLPEFIDSNIFDNELKIANKTSHQNYITAKYAGATPYEKEKYDADPKYKTPAGVRFTLTCLEGDPNNRTFK